MANIRTPENIEIAALKKKQAIFVDLMAPGPGIPWEDRGTHGIFGGFLKTFGRSLFGVGLLTDHIRRPETTNDARGFLFGCAICWGLSALIHGLLLMHTYQHIPKTDFDAQSYYIHVGIATVGAAVGMVLLFQLYSAIYAKLVEQEKSDSPRPKVLLYNTNAYAVGPSVLALIPFAGPPIALLWIFINLIVVGSKRLRLRPAAAIIDAVLAFVVVLVVGFACYWVGDLVLNQVIGSPVQPWDVETHSSQPYR
jgi:hypothetical protein